MKGINQEEYDQVILTIEELSCFKFSAGDNKSGAFLVPVNSAGVPMDIPEYFSWSELQKFANVLKQRPKM